MDDLHQWGAHEHPSLMSPGEPSPGNGPLLFFRVDDFDMTPERARALVTRLEEEPHMNPNTQTREFSLRAHEPGHSHMVARRAHLHRRTLKRVVKLTFAKGASLKDPASLSTRASIRHGT